MKTNMLGPTLVANSTNRIQRLEVRLVCTLTRSDDGGHVRVSCHTSGCVASPAVKIGEGPVPVPGKMYRNTCGPVLVPGSFP